MTSCPSCEAQNRPDQQYCWQCYARFPEPAATPTQPGPPGWAALPPPPPQRPDTPAWIRWAVTLGVGALAFVGGWFGVRALLADGFPFPDEVGGQPRMVGESVEDMERLYRDLFDVVGLEVSMAAYGTGPVPSHVIFVLDIPPGQTVEDVWQRLDQASGGMAPEAPVHTGGADFGCLDDPMGRGGASCLWFDEASLVELYGVTATTQDLEPVALDVREQTG